MTQLYTFTLAQIRNKLASGELTPTEVTSACLERINATDGILQSCLTVCGESALHEAEQLTSEGPSSEKPLYGVPITVKDVFCTKGIRTTCGSKMLENFVPSYDAFVIEKLKKAGAIIVAKTNMDEFAMGSTTGFSAFAKTSNPWNLQKIPGGSSGGSAVSVSAMQAFASLGSDTGGSIRQPAGFTGCVGIKPTYGRVSRYGIVAYASSFDQAGIFARTVEDCALVLSVIAGNDPKDATSSTEPVPSFEESLRSDSLEGKTLGLPKEFWDHGLSPEVEASCHAAVEKAKSLGAKVVEVSLPHLPYSVATYYILTAAEASTNLARYDGVRFGLREGEEQGLINMYIESRTKGFGEEVKRRILLGTYVLSSGYYDAYYKKASQVRRLIMQDYQNALTKCDALLAPSSPITAWDHGSFLDDPLTVYKMDILTVSLNLAGLPGMTIPVGLGNGMPVGLQIIGNFFDESGILSIGHALEKSLPSLGTPTALQ